MTEIKLKKFRISTEVAAHRSVWITRINGDDDGEDGWFDADAFEKVIEKFYNRYF